MPQVAVQSVSWASPEAFVREVYGALLKQGLGDMPARLLTAHISLSTNWGKSADNYRLAGMKADATWQASKPYTVVQTCECRAGATNIADSSCVCAAGEGQFYTTGYWRAYSSVDESLADILSVLRGTRYAASWALLQAGDTEYFAQLSRDGWYTADAAATKAGMLARLTQINAWLGVPVASGSWVGPVVAGLLLYWMWRS